VTTAEGEGGEEEGGHKFGGGGRSKWWSKLGEWDSAQLPPSTPVRRRRFRVSIKPGKFLVLDPARPCLDCKKFAIVTLSHFRLYLTNFI
jgi:hypothetical protein